MTNVAHLPATAELAAASAAPRALATFTPTNLAEAMEFSKVLASSDLVPKDYQGKPGNCLVAMQWGAEIGLQPLQAMQNIAVINGRPSLWGDSMLALCRAHPSFEWIDEQESAEKAVVRVKRRGQPECVREFSLEDAKRAGLAGKQGPWQQNPKRMMKLRARAFALRDTFTDVLRGMASAEELSDAGIVERDMGPAQVVDRGATRTEQVKAILGAGAPAQPTLGQVLAAIAAAKTPAELAQLGTDGAHLTGAELERARRAYSARKRELTPAAPAAAAPADPAARFAGLKTRDEVEERLSLLIDETDDEDAKVALTRAATARIAEIEG